MNDDDIKTDLDAGLKKYRELINKYHNDSLDFEFGNGYIIQATRNGFWYYLSAENLVIFTRKSINGEYVIVSSAGPERDIVLFEVAKYLYSKSDSAVTIKNVNQELEKSLINLGCRNYKNGERWDEETKYDDNTFPEQILDTKKTIELRGSTFQSLREEISRFNREYSNTIDVLEDCNASTVESLFGEWAESMHTRNNMSKEELHSSTFLFCSKNRGDLFHYTVHEENSNKLIGWLVFSEISPICLGYNVLVNNFDYRNSYRVLMLDGAKIANERGYKYLNIQGSEDKDQYLSKKRFHGDIEIEKKHLIYDNR